MRRQPSCAAVGIPNGATYMPELLPIISAILEEAYWIVPDMWRKYATFPIVSAYQRQLVSFDDLQEIITSNWILISSARVGQVASKNQALIYSHLLTFFAFANLYEFADIAESPSLSGRSPKYRRWGHGGRGWLPGWELEQTRAFWEDENRWQSSTIYVFRFTLWSALSLANAELASEQIKRDFPKVRYIIKVDDSGGQIGIQYPVLDWGFDHRFLNHWVALSV